MAPNTVVVEEEEVIKTIVISAEVPDEETTETKPELQPELKITTQATLKPLIDTYYSHAEWSPKRGFLIDAAKRLALKGGKTAIICGYVACASQLPGLLREFYPSLAVSPPNTIGDMMDEVYRHCKKTQNSVPAQELSYRTAYSLPLRMQELEKNLYFIPGNSDQGFQQRDPLLFFYQCSGALFFQAMAQSLAGFRHVLIDAQLGITPFSTNGWMSIMADRVFAFDMPGKSLDAFAFAEQNSANVHAQNFRPPIEVISVAEQNLEGFLKQSYGI